MNARDAEFEELKQRLATIADEAFGPFPTQPADMSLTEIERGIAKLRAELAESDADQHHICGIVAECGKHVTQAPSDGVREMQAELVELRQTIEHAKVQLLEAAAARDEAVRIGEALACRRPDDTTCVICGEMLMRGHGCRVLGTLNALREGTWRRG